MSDGFYIFIQREKDNSVMIFDTGAEKMVKYSIVALAKAVHTNQVKIYGFTDASKKASQPFTYPLRVPVSQNMILEMVISYPDIYIAIKSYLDTKQEENQTPNQTILNYKNVLEKGNQKFRDYLAENGYI